MNLLLYAPANDLLQPYMCRCDDSKPVNFIFVYISSVVMSDVKLYITVRSNNKFRKSVSHSYEKSF